MDQNIRGITSSFKGASKIKSSFEKSQGKKALNQFKPKNRKAEMVSKENPISPKSQYFITKQISTQAKHPKDPKKVSIKNSQKTPKQLKISQISNHYLNAHLNCKQALNLQKGNSKVKQVSLKKEELSSHLSKQKKHIPKQFTYNPSPNKNGIQTNINRNIFNTQYTREAIRQEKRIGRPKRTFSSSSEGKNSLYGIIAEYRRKNLRDSDSFDLKCSLENSITSANSQRAKNFNCQFQELNELLNSKSQNVLKYHGVQCQKQMPTNRERIADSCSSKQSIRSMTKSLSMSKNLIEEKFRLMKQHLKYRKGRFCYQTGNICKKQFSPDKQQTSNDVLDQSQSLLLKQFEDEYKKTDANSIQNELRRYKELYRNSLQKVHNISKQLEIQKKKNQLTKQIYKNQIQKLQRLHQFTQSIKPNAFEQMPESSFIESNVQLDGNRIQDLKQKLRTNHIFSYQKYNQFVSGNNTLRAKNQSQSNSDDRPSQRVENQHNTSTDMIVELSQEMKSSGFFNSTLARSQIFTDNIQNQCFKKNSNQIDSIKEDFMNSDFLINSQIPAQVILQKATNALEEKLLTQKQEQSLLLDISSNLNNTKSSNNDYTSQSQARFMDSEQTLNGFHQSNKKGGKRVQISRKFAQDCNYNLKINESQSQSTSNSTYMKSKYHNAKHQSYLYD